MDVDFLLAAHRHQLFHCVWLGDYVHHIACLQGVGAMWDERVLATVYSHRTEVEVLETLPYLIEGLADNVSLVVEFHHVHLEFATSKVVGFGGARLLQQ